MVFNECRAKMATHRWVNKKTGEATLVPKIFAFSAIGYVISLTMMPFITTGSAIFSNILFFSSVVTGVVGAVSRLMMSNCEYVESSEEKQRALREARINAEGPSFSERISMACKCRNNQILERDNTERGNSSEEGSKQGNYSFLRRINFIKRLNLIEKFSRKKNPEEHCILEGFQKHENIEESLIGDSSSRPGGYGTISV